MCNIAASLREGDPANAVLLQMVWARKGLPYSQNRRISGGRKMSGNDVLVFDPNNKDVLRRIESLRRSRRFDAAQKAIEEALVRLPGNVSILNQRAWLHYAQEQYAEAIQVFEQVLILDPKNEEALNGRIGSLRRLRRFDAAQKAIEEALVRLPDNVSILNQRAWLHYDQKQYAEAIQVFEQVLILDPKNEDALRWRIGSFRQLGDFDNATNQMKEALEKVPNSAETGALLEEQGLLFYDQDRFEEARKSFDAALALNLASKSASLGKVAALERLNRDAQALEVLRRLQSRFPEDSEVAEELGFFYLSQNDSVGAQKEFRSLLAKNKNDFRGINGMGSVSYYEGRYDEAADYFKQAVRLAPQYPVLHASVGWALVQQDREPDLDLAEKSCRRALELEPSNASTFGCLGMISFKRGRLREAEDYFLSSIDADKNRGHYAELGALYVLMGRSDDAETALKKAISLDKNDFRPRIELANLWLQTGKVKEAISECRQALAIAPRSDLAARALAIALMRADEFNEAEKVLREALRKQDEHRRWQLHLTLSQLLTRLADKTSQDALYEEALDEVKKGIRLKPNVPELHFQKGPLLRKPTIYPKGQLFRETAVG
jgi:tetratricopeptide (TPR) repeat protein